VRVLMEELNMKIKRFLRVLMDLFFGEYVILMYVPIWLIDDEYFKANSTCAPMENVSGKAEPASKSYEAQHLRNNALNHDSRLG